MPALTFADLQNIAGPVEAAVKALLETPPRLVVTHTQREIGDLEGERCDVQFTLGDWSGRWLPDRSGVLRHSAWRYTLRLSLCTKRRAENGDRHAELLGRIRASLINAVLSPDFLPHHFLASLDEQNGSESIAVGDDLDVSTLSYGGLVTIRSDSMARVG